jgi:hypothetical protein
MRLTLFLFYFITIAALVKISYSVKFFMKAIMEKPLFAAVVGWMMPSEQDVRKDKYPKPLKKADLRQSEQIRQKSVPQKHNQRPKQRYERQSNQ